jgi:type I restriction enzyme S subunit
MKEARVLTHFERIVEAPDSIPRLRRFILDLAVRGKLTQPNPSDEPASELLTRLLNERARLVEDGKVRRPKPLGPIKDGERLFSIPEAWCWCRLYDVGAIVGGGTPPSGNPDNFAPSGAGTAWLTPADLGMQKGLYVSHGSRDLSRKGLAASSATVMPKGSVLFTSRAPIGYTAIAAGEVSTNQGFKSVVPYLLECNRYIAVYFRAFAWWIDKMASGTTFREVSGRIVASLPFPLPPLPEQRRIADKVDELMMLCDRLETAHAERERRRDRLTAASLHRLNQSAEQGQEEMFHAQARFHLNHVRQLTARPEQVRSLREGILRLAVVGRLTTNEPSGRTASEELADLDLRKRDSALRKTIDLVPISVEEQWCDLPKGWSWARWGRIADWITYGFTRPMPHTTDGIPIVTGKNVNHGRIDFAAAHRTTNDAYLALSEKDRPQSGDILLTKDGSIGRSAIVNTQEPFCVNQSVAVLWLRSCQFDRRFLQLAIDCPQTQRELLAKTEGVAIKHISVVDFGRMILPIPPLGIQQRIVAKVDELMTICDGIEAGLATVQADRSRLLDAVLQQALNPVLLACAAGSSSPDRGLNGDSRESCPILSLGDAST